MGAPTWGVGDLSLVGIQGLSSLGPPGLTATRRVPWGALQDTDGHSA